MNKSKIIKLILFILVFSIYLVTSYIYIPRYNPMGDEPHYLVISQTLLKYHSLDVLKDYNQKGYQSFNIVYIADPHITKSPSGKILPVHSIGGPILWLIPFALLGRGGVLIFISLVSTGIIYFIYEFLIEQSFKKTTALIVSLSYAFATPIFIFAHLNFIEPIAAILVIYATRILFKTRMKTYEVILTSIAIGLLPWIHIRFLIIALIIIFLLLIKAVREKKDRIFYLNLSIPFTLLWIAFEIYTQIIWGSFNPAINYTSVGVESNPVLPFTGIIGTLFDQEYGLLINYPFFIFLFSGIVQSIKKLPIQKHISIASLTIPYIILFSSYVDWKGGWTPAGRYILVLLPVFAVYIGYAVESLNNYISKTIFLVTIIIGLLTDYFSLNATFHGFNLGSGASSNLVYLQSTILKIKITKYFPSSFNVHPKMYVTWILFSILVIFILVYSEKIKNIIDIIYSQATQFINQD